MILEKVRDLMWDIAIDSNYKKTIGAMMIHTAIDSGDLELVDMILQHDGCIDICNDEGYSPLHLAAFNGNIDMIRLLLIRGAETNIACVNTYETPLHFAAMHGNTKLFYFMAVNGADINLQDRNRISPLEQLLKCGHEDTFIELLTDNDYIRRMVCNRNLMNCYQRAINNNLYAAKDIIKQLLLINNEE